MLGDKRILNAEGVALSQSFSVYRPGRCFETTENRDKAELWISKQLGLHLASGRGG